MAIRDKDGTYNASRMNVLMAIANGIESLDILQGNYDQEDLDFIQDVKGDIAKAKAAGIDNPILSMPDL